MTFPELQIRVPGFYQLKYLILEVLMIILQWCKMQIMCLLILTYIGIIYMREGKQLNGITKKSNCNPTFDALFIVS